MKEAFVSKVIDPLQSESSMKKYPLKPCAVPQGQSQCTLV